MNRNNNWVIFDILGIIIMTFHDRKGEVLQRCLNLKTLAS